MQLYVLYAPLIRNLHRILLLIVDVNAWVTHARFGGAVWEIILSRLFKHCVYDSSSNMFFFLMGAVWRNESRTSDIVRHAMGCHVSGRETMFCDSAGTIRDEVRTFEI